MWWLIYLLERKLELLIVIDLLFLNFNPSVVYQKNKDNKGGKKFGFFLTCARFGFCVICHFIHLHGLVLDHICHPHPPTPTPTHIQGMWAPASSLQPPTMIMFVKLPTMMHSTIALK